ncbi:MAG: phosphate ABC transporter, permease protein PstA [Deltaproteobacteria bacterium RIFOXYA12_FULL_58_15]|nr:MAG: phosphate ABC transporter, permease protein PstA [Deltaproteobacteria bacterium RIFOXYA12_FULL_58_15]OGR09025.1 MAG: phosphate ABC transporter, permease protein PstA [Deltaproteobacteria bacterium RIFOXYB12_FULL_58_9]
MRIAPRTTQAIAKGLLLTATASAVGALVFVVGFVLAGGLRHVSWSFLTEPILDMGRAGGIFPAIVGTLLMVLVSVGIAAPLGIASAIYLAEYTREGRLTQTIRFGINCLAGVPSIIFGLFGFILFVNILGLGWSVLSGGLSLAAMILPTVIRTAEEALRSVPTSYRDVAASLGATRWQVVTKSVLPYAIPGILTGVILGIGRSIEETAVVIFTAGSAVQTPTSVFDSARTMAVHFYILAREGISNENAYATAAVLICTILIINTTAYTLMHRLMRGRRAA